LARKLWLASSILAYPFLVLTTIHSSAFAQESKWELEGHGGIAFTVGSPDGIKALPEASSFTTIGGHASKRVSSWMFGDGAVLLNQVLEQGSDLGRHPAERIVPIDSRLQSPLIQPRNGGAFGVRLGRRISSRLIAEVTADRLPRVGATEDISNQYLKTAETFSAAWKAVLRNYPRVAFSFGQQAFAESQPPTAGQGRLLVTGTVNFEFATSRKIRPYVVGGAGIESGTGTAPSATITGSYQYDLRGLEFGLGGLVQENDQVELTGKLTRNKPVGVAGGGVRIPISERFGIRADARVYLSINRVETYLSTGPITERYGGVSDNRC
jgi:hypothetical protein